MKISRSIALFISITFLFILALNLISPISSIKKVNARNTDENDLFLPIISKPFTPILSEMVYVPLGEFQMGCDNNNPNEVCFDNEDPLHLVYLNSYHIDKYEITNDQYAKFLNQKSNNNCDGFDCLDLDENRIRISYQAGQYVVDNGYGNHPVVLVTWYGANAYCEANGKRLPTEAEWEKAARGNVDTRMYPWGNESPDCTLVNFYKVGPEKCVEDTAPVGSFPSGKSMYGALDMSGNAPEWVNDWYSTDYYSISPYKNPPGPDNGTYKIQRGGSWYNGSQYIRVARRTTLAPSYTDYDPGFRCASSDN